MPKTASSPRVRRRAIPEAYHHGDLREALIAAAVKVLEERGAGGLSLRECARRAGVSHAAPAHHFGDLRGLLSEVAALGHAGKAAMMKAARVTAGDDAEAALIGVGRAYVEFALGHRALFALMHLGNELDWTNPRLQQAAADTGDHLQQTLFAVCAERGQPPADFESRAMLAWSSVHGFATLVLGGTLGPPVAGAATAKHDGRLLPMLEVLLPALVERPTRPAPAPRRRPAPSARPDGRRR